MDVEFIKYKFENKYDEITSSNEFKFGVRHLQVLYMFLTSVTVGVVRGCMGVAMMAVTDETRRNDTYIQIHTWDREFQGLLLFAYFFGYAVIFVPAELWLNRIDGKYVHIAVLLINGALCSAMPTIMNKGSCFAIFSTFLLMGMTQTGLSPANQALLDKWLPPNERSYLSWIVYGGVLLGILIGPPVAGVLSEADLGWELIYYSLAMMTLSMAVIYFVLTASSPGEHQAVGDSEKEYINSVITPRRRITSSVPWRDILKSLPFWGIACAHVFSNSAFIFYLTDVPVYLKNFDLTLKDSASWMVLPFFAMWIIYAIMKLFIQLIITLCELNACTNIIYMPRRRVNIRKIIQFICAVGSLLILLVLPISFSKNNSIILLVSLAGFLGFQFLGFLDNITDVTENYTEEVLMLSSAFANVIGAFIPMITGFVLKDDVTHFYRWRNILFFLATLCLVCNVIYVTFARSYRQGFDRKSDKVRKVPNNTVYSPIEMQLIPDK